MSTYCGAKINDEEKKVYKDDFEAKRNAEACQKFQKALRSSKYNKLALPYLKERKITDDMVEKFSIGWCPSDIKFPAYYEHLKPLSGRVIFPIKDEYGDVVSFSGRIPNKDSGTDLKWWHESYAKSFFLYGLDQAFDSIMKEDCVIIVEGQIDAITCHRTGLTNTVACMGTALTFQHIEKLSRLTSNFVIMFDGDAPGRSATKSVIKYFDFYNGANICKRHERCYYDIPLIHKGVGYDPDEFINKYGSKPIIEKIKKLRGKEEILFIGE